MAISFKLRLKYRNYTPGPILMKFDCGGNLEKMSIIAEESTVKNIKGRPKNIVEREGGGMKASSSGQMLLTGEAILLTAAAFAPPVNMLK